MVELLTKAFNDNVVLEPIRHAVERGRAALCEWNMARLPQTGAP